MDWLKNALPLGVSAPDRNAAALSALICCNFLFYKPDLEPLNRKQHANRCE